MARAAREDARARLAGGLRYTAFALAIGLSYVQPWYATWLLPLALASGTSDVRLGVAFYTTLVPALYLRGAGGAVAITFVQGAGLLLVFAPHELARLMGPLAGPSREARR